MGDKMSGSKLTKEDEEKIRKAFLEFVLLGDNPKDFVKFVNDLADKAVLKSILYGGEGSQSWQVHEDMKMDYLKIDES